jgi:hypothetical protein
VLNTLFSIFVVEEKAMAKRAVQVSKLLTEDYLATLKGETLDTLFSSFAYRNLPFKDEGATNALNTELKKLSSALSDLQAPSPFRSIQQTAPINWEFFRKNLTELYGEKFANDMVNSSKQEVDKINRGEGLPEFNYADLWANYENQMEKLV